MGSGQSRAAEAAKKAAEAAEAYEKAAEAAKKAAKKAAEAAEADKKAAKLAAKIQAAVERLAELKKDLGIAEEYHKSIGEPDTVEKYSAFHTNRVSITIMEGEIKIITEWLKNPV